MLDRFEVVLVELSRSFFESSKAEDAGGLLAPSRTTMLAR
jgi:hypothetical protein